MIIVTISMLLMCKNFPSHAALIEIKKMEKSSHASSNGLPKACHFLSVHLLHPIKSQKQIDFIQLISRTYFVITCKAKCKIHSNMKRKRK